MSNRQVICATSTSDKTQFSVTTEFFEILGLASSWLITPHATRGVAIHVEQSRVSLGNVAVYR